MRFRALLLPASLLLGGLLHGLSAATIHQVRVEGNLRVPAASVLYHAGEAGARAGARLDPAVARAAIERLRSTGAFDAVEVEVEERADRRVDLIFRVAERPWIESFAVTSDRFEREISSLLRAEKLELGPAAPFDPVRARRAAARVRKFLLERGYPNAECDVLRISGVSGTRVRLRVRPGHRLKVADLVFEGNSAITDRDLRGRMRSAPRRSRDLVLAAFDALLDARSASRRPRPTGRYASGELERDLERIRELYRDRGFAAVRVGPARVETFEPGSRGAGPRLRIRIPIDEGPRFTISEVAVAGDSGFAADETAGVIAALAVPRPYRRSDLDESRRRILAALLHAGYALARVSLEEANDRDRGEARATFRITRGDVLEIGEVRFEGNSRLRDLFLRRELRLAEGEIFDSRKLEASLAALDHSGLVEALRTEDVALEPGRGGRTVDVVFKVKDAKRQGLYGTGGALGSSGSHLGVVYRIFDLLGLGELLAFELDGGAAQSNLLVDLAARRFLGSPALLGLSLFRRYTRLNVASLLPDQNGLVPVLARRTSGFAFGTGFPVRSAGEFRLAVELERESTSYAGEELARARTSSSFGISFSRATTRGKEGVGGRFQANQSWLATGVLGRMEASRPSARFDLAARDPWTRGRNTLAFKLEGASTLPLSGTGVPLERRLFPGTEVARGFGRGALSPWIELPGSPAQLRPAGADSFAGFSAEYRAPIYGALGSAAFLDLGWSRISPVPGEQLVAATNGLPRISVGGELRLDVPGIRQPARLVFAWNPLRLDCLVRSGGAARRLADPRGAARFALGGVF